MENGIQQIGIHMTNKNRSVDDRFNENYSYFDIVRLL